MITEEQLQALAGRLILVPGIAGVMLGGSRARGDAVADSDTDLGLYYRLPLDLDALARLAREVAGGTAEITRPGDWGRWVDGGAWLRIEGAPVDWLYRNLDRVDRCWRDAQQGRYRFHFQVGHPLGVPDFAYAGEVALGRVLADSTGELAALHSAAAQYPPALRRSLTAGLAEAEFLLSGTKKVVLRGDAGYVAGCLFRIVGVCVHALHGHAGRWLVNEKGAIDATGLLPGAPADFAGRAHDILGRVGRDPAELAATVALAADLVAETAAACR